MLDTVSVETLRTADCIYLIDPNRPGWCMPLKLPYSADLVRSRRAEPTRLEIPVDSRDGVELNEWRKRIARLQLLD